MRMRVMMRKRRAHRQQRARLILRKWRRRKMRVMMRVRVMMRKRG
jgi:hypothetical protein